jgi:DDE superfamily endonuclease
VYRRNGTRFEENHIQVQDRSGRKTVPVWAWFSASGAGYFVRIEGKLNADKYINILGDILLPSIHLRFPGICVKFIQDKSPIHGANVIKHWFAEQLEIELLPWPAKGADLNPIENVWGDIVKDSEFFRPRTSDEVFERARSIWNGYSGNPNYWRKLAYSMVTRLRHVIDNNGGWTKY